MYDSQLLTYQLLFRSTAEFPLLHAPRTEINAVLREIKGTRLLNQEITRQEA